MSILLGCIVQHNLFTLGVHILMLNLGNWEFFLWLLIKIQNFDLYSTSFKYLGTTWTSIPKTKREGKVQIKPGVSLCQLYGRAMIKCFETFVLICLVSPGVDVSFAKCGTEKEVMVTDQMKSWYIYKFYLSTLLVCTQLPWTGTFVLPVYTPLQP